MFPLRLLLCFLGFAYSLGAASNSAHQSSPPSASLLLPGLINPLIQQRADPHVILHSDGYYYMTATVPEYDRIELRRANTLAGLASADLKVIWTKHLKGVMGAHIWAPEIHFIEGRWFVYFSAGSVEKPWAIRLYVLENASQNPLEGTWLERGQLKTPWETFCLDATTFSHRGQRYLVWTQARDEWKGTNIFLAKMDTPLSIIGTPVLLSRPEFPWEIQGYKVNEGPAVLVRNGRVWIAFSASATDDRYCLGLLCAQEDADLLEPSSWTKCPAPVFASSVSTSQFGPGHNSFTTTLDGKQVVLVYHARNYQAIKGDPLHNPDRHTRVQLLHWNADGSPDFGIPVCDGPLNQ